MKLQIRLPYGTLEYVGIIPDVKSDTETDANKEIEKLIKWSSDIGNKNKVTIGKNAILIDRCSNQNGDTVRYFVNTHRLEVTTINETSSSTEIFDIPDTAIVENGPYHDASIYHNFNRVLEFLLTKELLYVDIGSPLDKLQIKTNNPQRPTKKYITPLFDYGHLKDLCANSEFNMIDCLYQSELNDKKVISITNGQYFYPNVTEISDTACNGYIATATRLTKLQGAVQQLINKYKSDPAACESCVTPSKIKDRSHLSKFGIFDHFIKFMKYDIKVEIIQLEKLAMALVINNNFKRCLLLTDETGFPIFTSDSENRTYLKKVLPELLENTPMTTYLECESEQQ